MNRSIRRTVMAAAGAVALVLALTPSSAHAGGIPVIVTGTATCSTAGPVGRYTLNWTVQNGSPDPVTIISATESGAFSGSVTISPNPIPPTSSGTGSDGPVDNTTGTVTLTVVYSHPEVQGQAIGNINLPGTCVIPSTSSSVAPTSASTGSTASTSTTSTARAAATVATPRFTG